MASRKPPATLEVHGNGRVLGAGTVFTVAVRKPDSVPGIRVEVRLGGDGQSLYLEAYHWLGQKQPIRIVSTITGESIDLHGVADRPHPELAIIEVPNVGPGDD